MAGGTDLASSSSDAFARDDGNGGQGRVTASDRHAAGGRDSDAPTAQEMEARSARSGLARWLALAAAAATLVALTAGQLGTPWPWLPFAVAMAMLALLCSGVDLVAQRRRAATHRRSLERLHDAGQRVAGLQREIDRHTQLELELLQAKQAAESAAIAKGEFLATMSHEIRTPLNGIVPMLDLLMHAQLAPNQKELVRTAYTSSQQLLRIVDDILDYSKLEAERLVLESTAFNLRELLDTVLQMMERPAEAKGLRLHLQIDSNVRLPVRADPVRLRQVLTNLIGNAVKFTERGTVTVAVRRLSESAARHHLRFEVRDTGIGIEPDAQARLFRAFSQADASTTRLYGGTGLGLAICKRIVELMGGRIGVDSEPRHGSTFWFEVPVLKVQGDITAPDAADTGGRLLLISNDPRLRVRLSMLLPNWGFRVTPVETTQEALDRLRAGAGQGAPWAYSAVIADLTGMRSTALALHRNLERQSVFGEVRLICLYGEDYVPEELQRNVTLLSRQAPDPDLRQALAARRPAPRPERPVAPAPTPALTAASVDGDPAARIRHAKVLLVEDNPVNLMVGQRLLAVIGVNCDTASNGEVALLRMSAGRYDLVLMDCQMPVLDGYAATRRWRENEASSGRARRLPIVAMTANAMAGDRQKCLDAGMDDYLPKPVTRSELERCLHRWCKPGTAVREREAPDDAMPTRPSGATDAPADNAVAIARTAPMPAPAPSALPIVAAPGAQAGTDDVESGTADGSDGAIDPAVLEELREVLGDEVGRLIRVFLDDAPRLVASLEAAATRPDYPLLYQAAHSLKSSSANLGAHALSAAAKRIELAARAESLDRPAVAVALLANEFARARTALEAALAERDAAA